MHYISFLYFQTKKGHVFESETDTEMIAKLIKHVHSTHKDKGDDLTFRELVEMVIPQLVSSGLVIHFTFIPQTAPDLAIIKIVFTF